MTQSEAQSDAPVATLRESLSPLEFAARFKESFRQFWLIAVGVVRDAALADDVVQEAAVVALGKLDQYRPGTNFAAWMGQTVRYVALNQARREHRRRARSLDDETGGVLPPGTDGAPPRDTLRLSTRGVPAVDADNFDDRILAALAEVSDVARACLLLRTVEGLEYSEISRLLGVPEGTAMSHVHRTRQFLREKLADLWSGAGEDTKDRT